MKKQITLTRATLTLAASMLITACSDDASLTASQKLMADPIEVTITSLDDLTTLFDKYQYNDQSWEKGDLEIPRITFEGVDERWAEGSKTLPVETKKSVFFRLMAPLALVANEKVRHERKMIKSSPLDSPQLKKIALKYRLIKETTTDLNETLRKKLLTKVDTLPPSLILAQAAEESGWATSRFTQEGNAFFGQWDFTGKGMKPLAQREELGDYGVARFDSPLASVEGYLFNINTNNAFKKLRILRADLRSKNKAITGIKLAGTLDKYSERGQDYIDGLRAMIRYNKLEPFDQAYLSDNKLIHLITD
ncbi:glucosaminidase domain-containing protein [Psychromonas antarctica]|uniref:glucosaminidase domain-containing protein n=1 Tax=Psychromonas antarctica TaxID=67573 RepID=UPI001EE9788A|nr:glucosaminidase domain-containing protein [Psychromonas antarctica]MCG6201287.1 glucosaminidase domain-containing protein [Psychromonas antarctica]